MTLFLVSVAAFLAFQAVSYTHLDVYKRQVQKILRNVDMIMFAESLGGTETLITYPTTQTHEDTPKDVKEKLEMCIRDRAVGGDVNGRSVSENSTELPEEEKNYTAVRKAECKRR